MKKKQRKKKLLNKIKQVLNLKIKSNFREIREDSCNSPPLKNKNKK